MIASTDHQLVIINSNATILEAVKTLSQYRILAAPVRDVSKPDDASWTEKYLGIVDMVGAVPVKLECYRAVLVSFALILYRIMIASNNVDQHCVLHAGQAGAHGHAARGL